MKKQIYNKNPFTKESKEEFNIYQVQGVALILMFYIMWNEEKLELNLSIKIIQSITKMSKPSIIKAIRELEERYIIGKSCKKSNFYVNPKLLIGFNKTL